MIIIRKAKKGDEKEMAEMFNHGLKKGWNVYTGTNEPIGGEKLAKRKKQLSKYNKGFCVMVAVDTKTKRIVGTSSFAGKTKGRIRHRVSLGWGVHPDYAGQGIGTKMVSTLLIGAKKRGYKRAEAEAAVINIPSVKLAKKLGFKIEGRKKNGMILDNGRYSDTYIFGKIL